ncbi:hypothetical protein YC2023_078421 [Brassica napus]
MEEIWKIYNIVFDVTGLSLDSFIPPADIFTKEKSQKKLRVMYFVKRIFNINTYQNGHGHLTHVITQLKKYFHFN